MYRVCTALSLWQGCLFCGQGLKPCLNEACCWVPDLLRTRPPGTRSRPIACVCGTCVSNARRTDDKPVANPYTAVHTRVHHTYRSPFVAYLHHTCRERESKLDTFSGFETFMLLKLDTREAEKKEEEGEFVARTGYTEFVSHTIWAHQMDFEEWKRRFGGQKRVGCPAGICGVFASAFG